MHINVLTRKSANPPYSHPGLAQPLTSYGEACTYRVQLQQTLVLLFLLFRGASSDERLSNNMSCSEEHGANIVIFPETLA